MNPEIIWNECRIDKKNKKSILKYKNSPESRKSISKLGLALLATEIIFLLS